MRLTREEMLALWKRIHGYVPLMWDGGAAATETAATADELLQAQIDAWYDALLDRGQLDCLELTDIADSLDPPRAAANGAWLVELPAGCRRVTGLRLEGQAQPVELTIRADHPGVRARANSYCSRPSRPLAVVDTDARRITLYGADAPEVAECTVAMAPRDGSYEFRPKALLDIKTHQDI